MSRLVALLTDFGAEDPFVGILKGVLLARVPEARIVDLCHGVRPGAVRSAALGLRAAVPYFPAGTLFVCVVDPGVGSRRRVLWARGARSEYLAPDNGLLSWAEPLREVRSLRVEGLRRPRPVGATFHGRDVFAPAAAALLEGLAPERLGPRLRRWGRLNWPAARREGRGWKGEILDFDRFGNALTSLPSTCRGRVLRCRDVRAPRRPCYASVRPGEPLAVAGSMGFLELSVREGSFAAFSGACIGEAVHVE